MSSLLTSVLSVGGAFLGAFLYDLHLQRKASEQMLDLEKEDRNSSLLYERRGGTADTEQLLQMIYHLRCQVHETKCELITVQLFRNRVNFFMWMTTFYIVGHTLGGLCHVRE